MTHGMDIDGPQSDGDLLAMNESGSWADFARHP